MQNNKRVVHVVGTGTIGEPLIGLLAAFKKPLGIDEVTFHKRTPSAADRPKVRSLQKRSAKLAVDRQSWKQFNELGIKPDLEGDEAIGRSAVVIDCTPVGNENKNQLYLQYADKGHGFIAQGSEFGFGKMYARGINDAALCPDEDRFLQVVSCNTHNLAVLVDTIALGPEKEDNLEKAEFVCMRRANDISQEGEFIAAPEIGKHDDARFGTHQARDAHYLFKTLGLDLDLHSSAVKLNTQYMHVTHCCIGLRRHAAIEEIIERLERNPRVALTRKSLSSAVFSFGRDHGLFGRILNQTVVPIQSLAVKHGGEVVGFSFTPQDGNSLLSSIAAAEWFLYPDRYEENLGCVEERFFQEI